MQAYGLSSLPGRPRAWRQSLFCCWRMKPGAGSTSKNSTEYRCTVVEFSLDCGWMTSKPQIEVQPSPKVPLRPRNSACKVKSRLSHIIMMLPRRGNIMLVRYFTRPSRIEQLRSSTGGHLLEGFANELSKAVISGLQRESTFGQRNTFSIGSPIETSRSRALKNDMHSSSSIT